MSRNGPAASPARRIAAALTARFDTAALRVEPPVALDPARLAALAATRPDPWRALVPWCFGSEVLAVATLLGPDRTLLAHLVQACARELDGSLLLEAAPGGLARLRIRLGVKLHDAMWWRARRRTDPWDCGWLVDEPAAREALRRFTPRRATLVVCADSALFAEASAVLRANRAAFVHPVRLLAIGESPGAARLSAASPCA